MQSREQDQALPQQQQASDSQDENKENVVPVSVLKQAKSAQPQEAASVFARAEKSVTVAPSKDLFDGLIFYMEIFTNGEPADKFFTDAVNEFGGKVSRRLGKHITHLVWSQGRRKTLLKALEHEQIKIISTLWFQDTLNNMKLADEADFKPIALEKLLEKEAANYSDLHALQKGLAKSAVTNKKRSQANLAQARLYEHRQSEASRKTASKSKQDPASQNVMAEAGEEEVPFDIEQAIKRRKLEQIKKKDLDASVEDQGDAFAQMLSKKKPKHFEKFVDGDLSIDDYTAHLNQKTSKGGSRGQKRGHQNLNRTTMHPKATRRISEFFNGPKNGVETSEKPKEQKPANQGIIKMSLTDILAELDVPAATESEPEETKGAVRYVERRSKLSQKQQKDLNAFVGASKEEQNVSFGADKSPFQAKNKSRMSVSAQKVLHIKQPDLTDSDSFLGLSDTSPQEQEPVQKKRISKAKSQTRKVQQLNQPKKARVDTIQKPSVPVKSKRRNQPRACRLGVSYVEAESSANDQPSSELDFISK